MSGKFDPQSRPQAPSQQLQQQQQQQPNQLQHSNYQPNHQLQSHQHLSTSHMSNPNSDYILPSFGVSSHKSQQPQLPLQQPQQSHSNHQPSNSNVNINSNPTNHATQQQHNQSPYHGSQQVGNGSINQAASVAIINQQTQPLQQQQMQSQEQHLQKQTNQQVQQQSMQPQAQRAMNQTTQQLQSVGRRSFSDSWTIQLSENKSEYIIVIGSPTFPDTAKYREVKLENKEIQHQLIGDMYFRFENHAIRIRFGKRGLKEINPYRVLQNLYDKIYEHYEKYYSNRDDFRKNLEIYPQVSNFLMTPISIELIFLFHSYKYDQDNKNKEEQLRISNILQFDIYEEIRHNYNSKSGYHLQQVYPENQLDKYAEFQYVFKQNLFYGLIDLLKMDQIFDAIETQYVPYFVIQKIFFQLDDYFQPQYDLPPAEMKHLQRLVNDISVFPSQSCILFVPHNSLTKMRLSNDKHASERIDSRSFMQIRFDTCKGCTDFQNRITRKHEEIRKKHEEERRKPENAQNKLALEKQYEEKITQYLHEFKKMRTSINIEHEYNLKLSFSDLFYYTHQLPDGNHPLQQPQQTPVESNLRYFIVFEVMLRRIRSPKYLIFNQEKQSLTYMYLNQTQLELSIITFMSLIYQLHFFYFYYYYFTNRFTQQANVKLDFPNPDTPLTKDSVLVRMILLTAQFEVQIYVDYHKKDMYIFQCKIVKASEQLLQQQTLNGMALMHQNFIELQQWLLKVILMSPFMRLEVGYTFLSKGHKLIQKLLKYDNKAQQIINLHAELTKTITLVHNIDITVFEDVDEVMKKQLHQAVQNNQQNGLPQFGGSTINEDRYRKLFEINFDANRKNQLIIYMDGTYAFFSFYINSTGKKTINQRKYDPARNVFVDRSQTISQFLNI